MLTRIKHHFRTGHIAMTPTLSLSDLRASNRSPKSSPVLQDEACCLHTYNGSVALFQAASDMRLQADDAVLLPAYCCGAELGPFEHLGCTLIFYDVHQDMSVDIAQITDLLESRPDIRVLVVTHYLGVPQHNVPDLQPLCRQRQVVLLEDCAHALYSQLNGVPLGSFGDYAIFSPRKLLPLTEGGLLVAKHALKPTKDSALNTPSLVPQLERLVYSFSQGLRGRKTSFPSLVLSRIGIALCAVPAICVKFIKRSGLIPEDAWLTPDVEGSEAVPVYGSSSSALSRRILHHNNADEVISIRRKNHDHWVKCIDGHNNVTALLKKLPEGCCPLYFVVKVSNPGACVEALHKLDIEAFNWWQHKSHLIDWHEFPVARKLKHTLLALPVHQKVTTEQISSMAQQLVQIVEQTNK